MPETILWILLEVGVALALVPCVYGIVQWNHRRTMEKAIRALSHRVRQFEAERKHTLTAILTGAHRLPEPEAAELANSLILSERAFFRHCFTTMISQDKSAIERLAQNLYSVLDDYLRKCATDHDKTAPRESRSAYHEPDQEASLLPISTPTPLVAPIETAASPEPEPEEEIDWDAAFADLDLDNKSPPPAEEDQSEPEPAIEPMLGTEASFVKKEDVDDSLFDAADMPPDSAPATAEETPPKEEEDVPQTDEDIMAAWGAAFEEQTQESNKKEVGDDDFDLGWDDAFLEETVVTADQEKLKKTDTESV